MNTLMEIFSYLFPTGVGSAITWVYSRNVYRARKRKEVHDIYQEMYNDVCTTLTKNQDENRKLYRAIARLEKAVTQATVCRHWPDCPVRDELQESRRRIVGELDGQPPPKKKSRVRAAPRPDEPGHTGPAPGSD